MLSKTAHYIKSLQTERAKQKEEIEALKKDLEKLHLAIKYSMGSAILVDKFCNIK